MYNTVQISSSGLHSASSEDAADLGSGGEKVSTTKIVETSKVKKIPRQLWKLRLKCFHYSRCEAARLDVFR